MISSPGREFLQPQAPSCHSPPSTEPLSWVKFHTGSRGGNENPGVIWISNNNADSTFFSERFYPTLQILKKSRRSNRDDTLYQCVVLQDLSLLYGGKSVASFLFLELSIFSGIISGSKRYIPKEVRMSAVCQNKALIS